MDVNAKHQRLNSLRSVAVPALGWPRIRSGPSLYKDQAMGILDLAGLKEIFLYSVHYLVG